jgi:hypothetical protein
MLIRETKSLMPATCLPTETQWSKQIYIYISCTASARLNACLNWEGNDQWSAQALELIELDKVVHKLLFKSRIWRTPRGGKVYLCPSPILLKDTFVQTGSHLLILSLGHAPSLLFGTMFHTIKVFNHRY